ncbi:MAG: hypothetical protein ABJB69_09095 [Spartobacteria bacterium]
MRRLFRIFIITLSILWAAFRTPEVQAGPFVDFFKNIRDAITHPERDAGRHRNSRKRTATTRRTAGAPVKGASKQKNLRVATAAPTGIDRKASLRYGTPVPGKQGFVTSPFAPDGGFIDVRGFPPGTEVKDPYSGKIFLTP